MQNLASIHMPTLELLPLSIAHLVKYCKASEVQLWAIDSKITLIKMWKKIEQYEKLLVLNTAIAAYQLNPQISKLSNSLQLNQFTDPI